MMTIPESTSAEAFNEFVPGSLMAARNGWKNLLVRIYSEPPVEERVIYGGGALEIQLAGRIRQSSTA